MLNNRGDRDYSKDAELLKNGDFHEYKGGRGEFLLIQSYDMFVSTLTQAAVRDVPAPSHLLRKRRYLQ